MRMRIILLAASLSLSLVVSPQVDTVHTADASLRQALTGDWVGVLEYRDFSEPVTSTKRVDLPTWLSIAALGESMAWKYTYDDGPTKVLEETDTVTFDPAANSYTESSNGKPPSVFSVRGYEALKNGRGVLVLHGSGTDNDKPSETRITMTIRRNLLEITEEVRPAGSTDPFAFRHMFRFTRTQPPTVTSTRR